MHLAVIIGSPRMVQKSNTAKIMEAFLCGFEEEGNTSETWCLAEPKQWIGARKAYEDMGRLFAQQEYFKKEEVTEFAAPEYFSKCLRIFFRIINPIQKLMFQHIAKSVGCKENLDVKPYQNYVQKINA